MKHRHWHGALWLMGASGFAGLGYQIVWTQQGALWMGHESASLLAVVAAFFGGLGLGSALCGDAIERSARALRWYIACETAIGLWGLVLVFALPALNAPLARAIGVSPSAGWQWSVAFAGTFLLLLPATAAMGATLPAMERLTAGLHAGARSIAAVYAANTLGAMAGVLAAAFWLLPEFGLARTAALCATLNFACAAAAIVAFGKEATKPVAGHLDTSHRDRRDVLVRFAATGLLGIGYEVLVVRVLSQVAEDTVFTFALLLAVYLAGTAAGAAAYRHRSRSRPPRPHDGDWIGLALAAACLAGMAALYGAETLHGAWLSLWGAGMVTSVSAEAALAVAAFALPTFAMGAMFSHLGDRARASGISYGRSIAANTLGAAIAPALFGVWLAPAIGPARALLGVVAGYIALAAWRASIGPRIAIAATAAAVVMLATWAPPLAFVDVPEGGRILRYEDGAAAAVSVVEDAQGVARLRIDNREQEGSSASAFVDGRQALLPILLHPAPRRALFLGLGTGVTASTAAVDPTLRVDAVELLPEVIDASALFTRERAGAPSRLHRIAADARRFVRASPALWDVIVADNFHPARSGSGALYTVEHFRAVGERLGPHGLFCQWLPLHQLDLVTLRSIVRSFMVAYPRANAILASNSLETPVLGLVGRPGAERLDAVAVARRLATSSFPSPLASFGLADEYALLGSFVAGPESLARFAAAAPLNTDDRPVVAYRAPRVTYAPDSQPRDRLVALLRTLRVEPGDVLSTSTDAGIARRLAAYWTARDRFIEAGRRVRASVNVVDMLAQVRVPLLAALHTSPDFRPAYDPLLSMALALEAIDHAAADALLSDIVEAQPDRPEATMELRRLRASPH